MDVLISCLMFFLVLFCFVEKRVKFIILEKSEVKIENEKLFWNLKCKTVQKH